MEKKVDRRVIKTRRQLKKGLAALMKEKSVNQITVKELVEEVDINRSTFYLHFKDIQDLLREIEENIHRIERIIKENSRGTLEKMFPGKKEDLKYFYAFCLSGCLGLVKVWLNEGEEKSPEEMAQMTFNMIANAKDAFCQTASDFLDK